MSNLTTYQQLIVLGVVLAAISSTGLMFYLYNKYKMGWPGVFIIFAASVQQGAMHLLAEIYKYLQ